MMHLRSISFIKTVVLLVTSSLPVNALAMENGSMLRYLLRSADSVLPDLIMVIPIVVIVMYYFQPPINKARKIAAIALFVFFCIAAVIVRIMVKSGYA